MTRLPFHDHAGLPPAERTYLENAFAPFAALRDVLEWASRIDPPLGIADIVAQDEYSHDVIIPLPTGRFLIYGAT